MQLTQLFNPDSSNHRPRQEQRRGKVHAPSYTAKSTAIVQRQSSCTLQVSCKIAKKKPGL